MTREPGARWLRCELLLTIWAKPSPHGGQSEEM